jgi:uncharacterized protein with PQ loop repeat
MAPTPDHSLPEFWIDVLSTIPAVCGVILQLSMAPVAYRIYKEKSCGDLSWLPFLSLWMGSAAWFTYGFTVEPHDMSLILGTCTGILLGWGYSFVFHVYYENKKRLYAVYAVSFLLVLSLVLMWHFKLTVEIGWAAIAVTIVMMFSPLVTVLTVIRQWRITAMPIWPTIGVTMNCTTWLLYGTIIRHDWLLILPNMLGTISGCIQIFIYVLVSCTPGRRGPQSVNTDSFLPSVDMVSDRESIQALASFQEMDQYSVFNNNTATSNYDSSGFKTDGIANGRAFKSDLTVVQKIDFDTPKKN